MHSKGVFVVFPFTLTSGTGHVWMLRIKEIIAAWANLSGSYNRFNNCIRSPSELALYWKEISVFNCSQHLLFKKSHKGHTLYDFIYRKYPEWAHQRERKLISSCQALGGGGDEQWLLMSMRFLVGVMKMFWN